MNSLTKLVNLASRGQLPIFVAPVFCSATLTALNKKTGIRHIAVGEVIRRLVTKCIAKEAFAEAVGLFGAKQLGVAVRGGAERFNLRKNGEQKVEAYSKSISETHLIG